MKPVHYRKRVSNNDFFMYIYFYLFKCHIYGSSSVGFISSSAVAKTIKQYDENGSHEDSHRNVRPRVTPAAEDKFMSYLPQKLQPK